MDTTLNEIFQNYFFFYWQLTELNILNTTIQSLRTDSINKNLVFKYK